jgi:acetyltransferase
MKMHYLEYLFAPRSVAVVGATERAGALGRIAFDNLRAGGYAGELDAVNPKYRSVAGLPCYSRSPTSATRSTSCSSRRPRRRFRA